MLYYEFFSLCKNYTGATMLVCFHMESEIPDAIIWNLHYINKSLLPLSIKKFYCYRTNIPSQSTISQQIVPTLPAKQIVLIFFFNFRRTTVAWRAESLSYSQLFTHLAYRETNITGSSTTVQWSNQKLSIIVRQVPWLQKKTCPSDPT